MCMKNMSEPKVNFLVCGTQKGGTTALDAYLRSHPQLCMAKKKEVHFFDNEEIFKGSKPNYSDYHAQFSPNGEQLLGESTPIYMYWWNCPKRIWEYNPEMRIIVLLRNPIDRAFSHWNMERARGNEHLSFLEAIYQEWERCREALPLQHRIYSYIDRGMYAEQIRRLWKFFPADHVLAIKSDDLWLNPAEELDNICKFLGVSQHDASAFKSSNVGGYTERMDLGSREYLMEIFEFSIRDLERLLGWHCDDWFDFPTDEEESVPA